MNRRHFLKAPPSASAPRWRPGRRAQEPIKIGVLLPFSKASRCSARTRSPVSCWAPRKRARHRRAQVHDREGGRPPPIRAWGQQAAQAHRQGRGRRDRRHRPQRGGGRDSQSHRGRQELWLNRSPPTTCWPSRAAAGTLRFSPAAGSRRRRCAVGQGQVRRQGLRVRLQLRVRPADAAHFKKAFERPGQVVASRSRPSAPPTTRRTSRHQGRPASVIFANFAGTDAVAFVKQFADFGLAARRRWWRLPIWSRGRAVRQGQAAAASTRTATTRPPTTSAESDLPEGVQGGHRQGRRPLHVLGLRRGQALFGPRRRAATWPTRIG